MTVLYSLTTSELSMSMETNFSIEEWDDFLSRGIIKSFLIDMKNFLIADFVSRLDEGRDVRGKSFSKLDSSTVKYKRDNKKLFYTGRLRQSFRSIIVADELIVYNTAPYAKAVALGGTYVATQKQSWWLWYNVFKQTSGTPPRKGEGYTITVPERRFMGHANVHDVMAKKLFDKYFAKLENMGK
jgi:phage gpG-like protein